ncbi:MAG: hypothetical protein ABEK16_01285 [Candidatus Nanohalobium sp.]
MIIRSNGAEVSWEGIYEEVLSDNIRQNILNEVPDAEMDVETSNPEGWTIEVIEGNNDIEVENKTIRRYGKPGEDLFEWDLVYLTEQTIERQNAEDNLHTIHAGGIERDGNAVVFAGPSMTGKSVLTAYGVQNGYNFAGGEKVVFDGSDIVSSSRKLNVDEEAAKRFLNREEVDETYPAASQSEIEAIVFPKVTDGELSSSELSPSMGRLKLMEVLDEKLRGDYLISNQTLTPYNLETDETRESRKSRLEEISEVDYLFIEGFPQEIYREVDNVL